MGLLFSVLLSYAGTKEAIETIKHILSGVLPEGDPNFDHLVEQYTELLRKSSIRTNSDHWTQLSGQGYLCLKDDEEGNLTSASVKYYGPDSTALLFSTKISSFGDSLDSNSTNRDVEYGNKRTPERYTPTTTAITPQTTQSFRVESRDRSTTGSYENISDPTRSLGDSFERRFEEEERSDTNEKLTWHYRPLSPGASQDTLPEIHFQSYETDTYIQEPPGIGAEHDPNTPYSDDYLRSRSREKSKETKPNLNESLSLETSGDSYVADVDAAQLKSKLKDLPKLGSFEEEQIEEAPQKDSEVNEEEVEGEELDDFCGNSDD